MLALQDAELLSKQQDFEVFLLLGAPHSGNQVEQASTSVCEEEVDHVIKCCRQCASSWRARRQGTGNRACHAGMIQLGRNFRTLHVSLLGC